MNTKQLTLMALLVAVGAALYLVIPGYGEGMKPDFMLTMMIIGILLFPDVRSVFLLGATTGVLSGIFTSFPGGFIPNIIDKPITAFVVYAVILLLKKTVNHLAVSTAITCAGTILSGSIFLLVAIYVMGATVPFGLLFVTVVLPTVAMNGIVFFIIYPIIKGLLKRTSFKTALSN
ncbi:tryptophan transporter [Sporosarcina thermotolerans]|uniref:Tryptophan transporter n=1 Tax=Sporosarcina thermotolerans TaxID=633404 RepID=A0AAW9AA91_9BACL|nr:tryptophan transporter [Sporosarcina thermotolerans]MDW0118392.1 tryptophan transporter [Sporosarcina thermotolerans]WHT49442.1 tryptophan transporter [Sporosarcina thermotolerans]